MMNRLIQQEVVLPNLVVLKSVSVTNQAIEIINYEVALENGLQGPVRFAVRYFGANDTKNKLVLAEDSFLAVLESTSYTNPANNVTSGLVNLANVNFNPLKLMANGTGFNIIATDVANTFQFIAHVVPTVVMVGATPVRPTSVKLDVNIKKTTAQNLNLNAMLYSSQDIEVFEDATSAENDEGFVMTAEKQISFGVGAVKNAFFSWTLQATINGVTIPVLDAPLPPVPANGEEGMVTANKKSVVFTFPTTQIGTVLWDPKLGMMDVALASSQQDTITFATNNPSSANIMTNANANGAERYLVSLSFVFIMLYLL